MVLIAVHWAMALQMDWYSVLADEAGYLGNARWLSHAGPDWPMWRSSFYSLGYPLLVSPLPALTDGPREVYIGTLLLNGAMLSTLFPLLAVAVRRVLDAPRGVALLAAAAGSLYPAALLQSNIAWSENLVMPITVCLVLSVDSVLHRSSRGIALGLVGGAVTWVHPRFWPIAAVAALVVVIDVVRHRSDPGRFRAVVTAGVLAAMVAALGLVLSSRVADDRWVETTGSPGSGNYLRAVTRPRALTGQVAGELWYVLCGSFGLAALGLVAVGVLAWRGGARRTTAIAVVAMTVGIAALSVLSSYHTALRPDQFVYGRYNEAVVPLLTALGAAWLVSLASGRARVLAFGVTAALAAGSAGVLVVARTKGNFEGDWNVLNIMALGPWIDEGGRGVIVRATVAVVLVGLAGAALAWRLPRVAVGGVSLAMGVGAVMTFTGPLLDRQDQFHEPTAAQQALGWIADSDWDGPHEMAVRFGWVDHAAYDVTKQTQVGLWGFPLFLPDAEITMYDPALGEVPPPDTQLVIGAANEIPPGVGPDATLAWTDPFTGHGFWLLPSARSEAQRSIAATMNRRVRRHP